jgi:hypothetical protein
MIGKATQLSSLRTIKRIRVLAALLLASLAWGTTAEFTHNHGSRTRAALVQTQATDSSFESDHYAESTNKGNSSSRSKSSAECLICQLHQNLSNSVLGHALAIASVETHVFVYNPDLVLHRADFSQNQRDRAPPLNL